MQSRTFTLDELPGLTFTLTRGGPPPPDPLPEPVEGERPYQPIPDEWLTLEAHTAAGDLVLSNGMLGPTPEGN